MSSIDSEKQLREQLEKLHTTVNATQESIDIAREHVRKMLNDNPEKQKATRVYFYYLQEIDTLFTVQHSFIAEDPIFNQDFLNTLIADFENGASAAMMSITFSVWLQYVRHCLSMLQNQPRLDLLCSTIKQLAWYGSQEKPSKYHNSVIFRAQKRTPQDSPIVLTNVDTYFDWPQSLVPIRIVEVDNQFITSTLTSIYVGLLDAADKCRSSTLATNDLRATIRFHLGRLFGLLPLALIYASDWDNHGVSVIRAFSYFDQKNAVAARIDTLFNLALGDVTPLMPGDCSFKYARHRGNFLAIAWCVIRVYQRIFMLAPPDAPSNARLPVELTKVLKQTAHVFYTIVTLQDQAMQDPDAFESILKDVMLTFRNQKSTRTRKYTQIYCVLRYLKHESYDNLMSLLRDILDDNKDVFEDNLDNVSENWDVPGLGDISNTTYMNLSPRGGHFVMRAWFLLNEKNGEDDDVKKRMIETFTH